MTKSRSNIPLGVAEWDCDDCGQENQVTFQEGQEDTVRCTQCNAGPTIRYADDGTVNRKTSGATFYGPYRIPSCECGSCGSENLMREEPHFGAQRVKCKNCGQTLPGPDSWFLAEPAAYIGDPKIILAVGHAKGGDPAWICGYCESVNPASDKKSAVVTCSSCGAKFRKDEWYGLTFKKGNVPTSPKSASLKKGEKEAHSAGAERSRDHTFDAPSGGDWGAVPIEITTPAPPPSRSSRRKSAPPAEPPKAIAGLAWPPNSRTLLTASGALALILAIALLVHWFNTRPLTAGVVTAWRWQSAVDLYGVRSFQEDDWDQDVPSGAYNESCSLKWTGAYEQKSEEYISGYGTKSEDYSCTKTGTRQVSCTKFDSDGTSYSDTCSESYTYEDTCTRQVSDYSDPHYSTRMVDDPTRPINDQWCSYTIDREVVVRTVTRDGDGQVTAPPLYEVRADETRAGAPAYQYWITVRYKETPEKDQAPADKSAEFQADRDTFAGTDASTLYVVEFTLSDVPTGIHPIGEKEAGRIVRADEWLAEGFPQPTFSR